MIGGMMMMDRYFYMYICTVSLVDGEWRDVELAGKLASAPSRGGVILQARQRVDV
jgi:hypothetical protein